MTGSGAKRPSQFNVRLPVPVYQKAKHLSIDLRFPVSGMVQGIFLLFDEDPEIRAELASGASPLSGRTDLSDVPGVAGSERRNMNAVMAEDLRTATRHRALDEDVTMSAVAIVGLIRFIEDADFRAKVVAAASRPDK